MIDKFLRLYDIGRFYIVDTLALFFQRYLVKNDLLLVRLDAIGDFVLWLDSAKEFRRLYPNRRITLCANAVWAGLAKRMPYWDEVWPIDVMRLSQSLVYRFNAFRKIRNAGFEIAIQPTFSRFFSHGDSVVRATGAAQRIGSEGDLISINRRIKPIADRWYTALIPVSRSPQTELERNAEFIRNLSGQDFEASLPTLPRLTQLPDRLKIKTPYFIVFPGASWSGRQWPSSLFVEVIRELHHRYGWLAVLCGSSSEARLCQTIVDQSAVMAVNLGGATNLSELGELLRGARILISNETSAVHLAAAVSTPTVCILGGGHFGRFLPYPKSISGTLPAVAQHKMACYNCDWICTQVYDPAGAVPCVGGVTVADVLALVDAELAKVDQYGIKLAIAETDSDIGSI